MPRVRFVPQSRSSKADVRSARLCVHVLVCRDDGLSARDHLGRGAVEPFHQRLHVGAADEAELEVHLCGLGDELRVAHGGGEGRAQRLAHLRMKAGRCDQGTAHGLWEKISSRTWRSAEAVTNASSVGTSGSSLCLVRPSCMRILSRPEARSSLLPTRATPQEYPTMPSSSPRSMASMISCVPG